MCSLRFAHRSRPSSFGEVQREEDANAFQETICVSSVFCRGMHPARWDCSLILCIHSTYLCSHQVVQMCRSEGCWHCCAQWSKKMLPHIRCWKEMHSLMNVSILCNYKGLLSQHCVPRQTFPHELHNGTVIRFLTWSWTFRLLLEHFVLCRLGHLNCCPFTAFCGFFYVDIFPVLFFIFPKYFPKKAFINISK